MTDSAGMQLKPPTGFKPYGHDAQDSKAPASRSAPSPPTTSLTRPAPAGFVPVGAPSAQPEPQFKRPDTTTPDFTDSYSRGFRRTIPQDKELLGAAGIAAGQLVGSEGLTDASVGLYNRGKDAGEHLQGPGLQGVIEGKAPFRNWAGNTLGNLSGQVLQSAIAGGAGAVVGGTAGSVVPVAGTASGAILGGGAALIGRKGAMNLARNLAEKYIAEQVKKGVAKSVAEKGAAEILKKAGTGEAKKLGALTGVSSLNIGQETGSAVQNRMDQGVNPEDITKGQAAGAIAAGTAAGVLDTAAELFNLGRVLHGKSVNPSLLRRIAAESLAGSAREGGTEVAQSALERLGGGASLTNPAALSDYFESGAAGALGGGVFSAPAGIHRPSAGPITRAAQADAQANPQPTITRPGSEPNPGAAPGTLSDAANTISATVPQGNGATTPSQVDKPVKRGEKPRMYTAQEATQQSQARLDELNRKESGSPDIEVPANPETGAMAKTIGGEPAQPLTAAEETLRSWLGNNMDRPEELAKRIGGKLANQQSAEPQLDTSPSAADTAPSAAAPEQAATQPSADTQQPGSDTQVEPDQSGQGQSQPDNTASVPVMITHTMRQDLADRGHDPQAIAAMTPQQANDILSQPAAEQAGPTTEDSANGQSETPEQSGVAAVRPTGNDTAADSAAQGEAGTTQASVEPTYNTAETIQDADIPAKNGDPYKTRRGAETAAKQHEGGRVFAVEDGFVIRTPTAPVADTGSETLSAPATEQADQAAAETQQSSSVVPSEIVGGSENTTNAAESQGTSANVGEQTESEKTAQTAAIKKLKWYRDRRLSTVTGTQSRSPAAKELRDIVRSARDAGLSDGDIVRLLRKPGRDMSDVQGIMQDAAATGKSAADKVTLKDHPLSAYPAPDANGFVTTKTLSGDTVRVRARDIESGRELVQSFSRDGKTKPGGQIHRLNLDPTGEKRQVLASEAATNPVSDVITTKNGAAFKNRTAAQREVNRQGLTQSHEVVPADTVRAGEQGFVGLNTQRTQDASPTKAQAETPTGKKALQVEPEAEAGNLQSTPLDDLAAGYMARMHKEVGWDQRGGQLLRAPEKKHDSALAEVIGRTKWIGKPSGDGEESMLWRDRPSKGGKLKEKEALKALDKFHAGEPLKAREQRFIEHAQRFARLYAEAQIESDAEFAQEQQDMESAERETALQELRSEGIDISREELSEALTLDQWMRRAADAGTTNEDILAAIATGTAGEQYGRLSDMATDSELRNGTDSSKTTGTGQGSAETDQSGQAATGTKAPGFQLDGGSTQSETAPQVAPAQQSLLAPPTSDENIQGARKGKDAARNGLGRDVVKPEQGDGQLLAGQRPDQADIEGEHYVSGHRVSFTGKTQNLHGGTFQEFTWLEGPKKGQTGVKKAPDQSTSAQPNADSTTASSPEMPDNSFTVEPLGSKAIVVAGDAEQVRAKLKEAGFKKRGRVTKAGLRFDASDRAKVEAALSGPVVRESLTTAADQAAASPTQIDDFGEKLGGARKDQAPSLSEDITDADMAKLPLGKIWPAKEIDQIQDPFAKALAFAARAEIQAKPRKSYKVNRWIDRVKLVRGLAQEALSGRLTLESIQGRKGLGNFAAKVNLLLKVDRDQWSRIDDVREFPDAHTLGKDGKRTPAPHVSVSVDGQWHVIDGKAIGEVMDKATALLDKAAPGQRMKFELRGSGGKYAINKKGDGEYRHLKEFTDVKEGRAYLKDNHDELVQAWEKVKQSDNVTKADMRGSTNRGREGKDYRNGENVTPEQFSETFGFRGVEFGNWVKQGKSGKQRQAMLNDGYDALMDLAAIVGVPPKAISLNGSLGLGFGSRGHGWASAHFEPTNLVINLTKTRGAGALAHEWFHALDNYFARARGVPEFDGRPGVLGSQDAFRKNAYITYRPEPMYVYKGKGNVASRMSAADLELYRTRNPKSAYFNKENWVVDPNHPQGVRPEVEKAFAELVKTLNDSPMKARAATIDKGKSEGYWSQIIERGARSFENYVISKLEDTGITNDYLANVTKIEDFNRDKARYPYLLKDEIEPVAKAFDNLFNTIDTKETEDGNVAMFSLPEQASTDNEPFYSQALRTVEEAKGAPKKGTAQAWKGWLDGATKRGDMKQAERDWLGIDAWLNDQDGKVSREQLAGFVRENQVQIRDVTLQDSIDRANYAVVPDGDGWNVRAGPANGGVKLFPEAFESKADAEAAIDEQVQNETPDLPTKFSSYQLPGGENYKELLLTVPVVDDGLRSAHEAHAKALLDVAYEAELQDYEKAVAKTAAANANRQTEYQQQIKQHIEKQRIASIEGIADGMARRNGGSASDYMTKAREQSARDVQMRESGWADEFRRATPPPSDITPPTDYLSPASRDLMRKAMREVDARPPPTAGFKSSHFEQPNVLAHIRFNERTDADGKRVLFLEEVQSDWHQAGRKQGYGSRLRDVSAAEKIEWRSLRDRSVTGKELSAEQEVRFRELDRLMNRTETGVPDAPFKNTPQWATLAFKRMARYAAENGFERIAWTTGEQQAQRYDLSKQVSEISVTPFGGYRSITVTHSGGSMPLDVDANGKVTGGESTAIGKTLDEVIGKELAEKALAVTKRTSFSGDDLKVGGEGMRAFYDKILPNAVNKWAKQFGGRSAITKVGALGDITSYTYTGPEYTLAEIEAALVVAKKTGENINTSPLTGDPTEFPFNRVDTARGLSTVRDAMLDGLPFKAAMEDRADFLTISARDGRLFGGRVSVKQNRTQIEAHSLDITPDMKAAALGGLQMFRMGTAPANAKPATVAQLRKVNGIVAKATAKWGDNQPLVRVLHSPEMLPAEAKRNPRYRKANGFYDGRTVYLIASNLNSPREVMKTLTHEAVGHYGVMRIIEKELGAEAMTKLVDSVMHHEGKGTGGTKVQAVLKEARARYGGISNREFAEEVLAVMSEKGVHNTWMDRVMQALRKFLRRIMPNLKLNGAELRQLLAKSDKYLRSDGAHAQQVAMVQGMMFDQAPQNAGPGGSGGANFSEQFPLAKNVVDGRQVGESVKNRGSIDASLSDPHELPGIREVSMDAFDVKGKPEYYSAQEHGRTDRLAAEIKESGRVDPLIVAIDDDGPYILEGGHRFDALRELGAKSFPAVVVRDGNTHGANFSLPASSINGIDQALTTSDKKALERTKGWLAGKWEDIKPATLGALQLRHLLELMEGHQATRGVKAYQQELRLMESDRNQMFTGNIESDENPSEAVKSGDVTTEERLKYVFDRGVAPLAEDWKKWGVKKGMAGWFGAITKENTAMQAVAHDATLMGMDPSKGYEKLTFVNARGDEFQATPKNVKERVKLLRAQMLERGADDKSMLMDEVKRLRGLPGREKIRAKNWPGLVKRFDALSPEAKQTYKDVRDWYAAHQNEVEKALIERIDMMDIPETYKRSLSDRIRLQFEMSRREGVYFPLNRDGDYWMSVTDADGQQAFLMFENAKELVEADESLRAKGYKVEGSGRRDTEYRATDAPSGTFVKEVITMMKKSGSSERMQNDVYQLFLKTLPEMSMRKRHIKRGGVPGYSKDAFRAFAKNGFHGSYQLARLRHSLKMQTILEATQESVDNSKQGRPGENSKDSALENARVDAMMNELKLRHDWIMSPKDSQLANKLTSIGFIYYLGLSPASAIVNLTQNAQVTLPVLAARHGWGKASRALGKAEAEAFRSGANIAKLLKGDELRAYKQLVVRGDIENTESHTLAALAEGNAMASNPVWSKTMTGISWMFHKAEVVNREAAGLASFRLARSSGMSFNDSVDYASEIVNGTHFDYSAANRPRYMQNGTAKVLLQFKNFSVGMTWRMYRDLYQTFKGESVEVRREARRSLTGIMGMTALMAGTMGLPIINLFKFVANAAVAAFGDDDEPWDFNTEFRQWLTEHFGDTAASLIADGVADKSGAKFSSRVSLSDLWFRDADRQLEGRDAYYNMLESMAGPMGGLLKNVYVGAQQVRDGHTWRGVERMLPNAIKNSMKAMRYEMEGVNTLRGAPVIEDPSALDSIMQGLGFQPTKVGEQWRENSAIYNYKNQIRNRRISLMNAYAMALHQDDTKGKQSAMVKIRKFNRKYPGAAITATTIRQSLRGKARAIAQARNGVVISKRIRNRVLKDVGAEP